MTQYTYFQQAAGLPLPVPSVEITYGLERIMTALQVGHLLSALALQAEVLYSLLQYL